MENTFGRPWVITLNREISCQRCKPGHISSRHEDSFNLPKPFKSNMCPCCYNAFTQLSEALASFKPDVDHGQEALIVNYPHHSTTTMLCEAVEVYGCRVCWLLHDVSNDLERRCSVGGAHLQPGDLHMYHSPYKMLGVDLKVRDASFQALVKHLVMENLGSEGDSDQNNERATLSTSSNYEASFLQAQKWLHNCLERHPDCNSLQGISDNALPTRLLCVRHDALQVCDSSSLDSGTRYVTLSHCWGKLPFTTLTRARLEAFSRSVTENELCKTFQDAIAITRRLGFEYIWIDSLCIIQDDKEDWNHESTSMSQVYGNSSLNIAAASAWDGRDGCLFDRFPPYLSKFEMELQINGQNRWLTLFNESQSWYDRLIYDQPLVTRAWALQERLLPLRTLHFSRSELYWECKSQSACESFPVRFPDLLREGDNFYAKNHNINWREVVVMYTRANLTKTTDKLVAIAGVAKRICNATGDEYLAGMWRGSLENDLCWYTLSPAPKPNEYRAPSWSWAAVDSPIRYTEPRNDYPLRHQYSRVVNARVNFLDGNTFGNVVGGSITMCCETLLSAFIKFNTDEKAISILTSYTAGIEAFNPPTIAKHFFHETAPCWDCSEFAEMATLGVSVYILPLWKIEPPASLQPSNRSCCLLLQRTMKRPGQYSRVGTLYCHPTHPISDYEWIAKMADLPGMVLDSSDYISTIVDDKGQQRYIIEIV